MVNVSDTLRTSASSAVKKKDKNHEKSNRRERRGTRRMVNVSDALRTSASSAVKKLTETFKTIDPSRVQSQKKITREKHGIK